MNNKLLFGIGIFLAVLLVTVPSAEAGWFEDLVDWLKDVFGFTQTEAEALANDILTENKDMEYDPYSDTEIVERLDGLIRKTTTVGGGVVNVDLDNNWNTKGDKVRTEKALSLVNKTYKGKKLFTVAVIEDDSDFKIDVDDFRYVWNGTAYNLEIEAEVEILNSAQLGKKIPIKNDGKEFDTVNLKNLGDKEKVTFLIDGLGKRASFGFASEEITISGNQTTMEDTDIWDNDVNANFGAYTGAGNPAIGRRQDDFSTDIRKLVRPTYFDPIIGNIVESVSFEFRGDTDQVVTTNDLHLFSIEDYWQEGNNSGTAGDASWNERISGTDWGGTVGGNGSIGYLMTAIIGIGDTSGAYNYTFTLPNVWGQNVVDNSYDAVTPNNSFMIMNQEGEAQTANSAIEMHNSEHGTVGERPIFRWIYSAPTPNDPSVLVANSTVAAQTNYTTEDLSFNFLCAHPTPLSMTWSMLVYKDGVEQFVLDDTCTNNEYVSTTLTQENTTVGDAWSFGVVVEDSSANNNTAGYVYSNNLTVLNDFPAFTGEVALNSTDGTNLSNEDLHVRFTPTNSDGHTITANVTWIKNNITQFTFLVQSVTQDVENVFTLTSGNTTLNDDWNAEITLDDPYNSTTQNSTHVTILSSLTTPSLFLNSTSLEHLNQTNETLECSFLCEDLVGGNSVFYDLEFWENDTSNLVQSAYNSSCTNPSYTAVTLDSSLTVKPSVYGCNVNLTNSVEESTATIYPNNNVTITTKAPHTIILNLPLNETVTENNTITYNVSGIDDDPGDKIFFQILQEADTNPPTVLLSLETSPATNFTEDGTYYWRARGEDEFTGQSPYTDPFMLTIDNATIRNYVTEFVENVTEGESTLHAINITMNPIAVTNITNVTLLYENIGYPSTRTDINASEFRYAVTFNTPAITDGVNEFNWSYFATYLNGTLLQEETRNYEQGVSSIGIISCDGITNSTQALAFNFTGLEETNNTQYVHGFDFDGNFIVWKDDQTINKTLLFSLDNQTEVDVCIQPPEASFTTDSIIEYISTEYDKRFLYLDDNVMDNNTKNFSLGLLLTSRRTDVVFDVIDDSGVIQKDAIIKAQRYYPGEDVYKGVAMGKTDDAGQDTIPLRLTDAIYRFVVQQAGATTHISIPSKLTAATQTLIISPETVYETIEAFEDVTATLTFNNDTKNIVATFDVQPGDSRKFCLRVTQIGATILYDDCVTSNTGTLTYKVAENKTAQITAVFYGDGNIANEIETLEISQGAIARFIGEVGINGVWYLVLLNGTLAGMGLAMGNAIFALISIIFGTAMMTIFGVVSISWASMIGLAFVVIITITLMRREGV